MALDPNLFFYSDGTITLTNGSDIATGDLVAWDPAVLPFDFVFPNDGTSGMTVIKEVLAVNQIRLMKPWGGPDLVNVPYAMVRWTRHTDPRIYALRVSDYLTRLKAIPENLEEVAAEINADRQAVDEALVSLGQIEDNVDADRQAVDTAATTVEADRQAAVTARNEAQAFAEAASTTVLPNDSVTNTKLANMATARIKGRSSAGTGDPEDLTAAQARSLIGVAWEQISSTYVAVNTPAIVVPISSGIRMIRMVFRAWFTVNDTYLMARFSNDGGATYLQAAGQYNNSHGGSASAGLFQSNNTLETYARWSSEGGSSAPCLSQIIMDVGSEGGIVTYNGQLGGQHSANGSNWRFIQGYMRLAQGPITHITLFPLSGQIAPKTQVIVEGVR